MIAIRNLFIVMVVMVIGAPFSWALGDQKIKASSTLVPGQFSFVEGDFEKFQAHHWMKEDYVGGVKNAQVTYGEKDSDEIYMEADGGALVGNGDYRGSYLIEQKDAWSLKFHYDEFRKYYDGTGGVYHRFTRLSGIDLDRELALDIGKFEVDLSITPENLPDIHFYYEHEFREGAKSRLTWASVTEGAITRNIAPSWQELDEQADIFGVRIEEDIKGFHVYGEQKIELVRIESRRYEKSYSTNTGNLNQNRVRTQDQDPQTNLFTSTVGTNKWFWEDRAHFSTAYQYSHLDNKERENLREFDSVMNPRCLSGNCENKFDAQADNTANVNTIVLSGAVFPIQFLNITTRLKAESTNRDGDSSYPSDTTDPPDHVPNRTELSNVANKIKKIGEGISIRFKGIPRTAVYTEFEGEHLYNTITEDRISVGATPSAGEVFSRETETPSWRGVWTAGFNTSPIQFLTLTNQFRYRSDNNSYQDERETIGSSSQARSAFFEELDITSAEINSRAAFKPTHWFQAAVRHKLKDTTYNTRVENQGEVKPESLSNIFSYDLTLFPIAQVSVIASYVQENFQVISDRATSLVPAFRGDVDTWLFAVAYAIKENLSLNTTTSYTRANNFDDFTDIGLPLGADFNRIEATLKLDWKLKNNLTLGPQYAFYHYHSDHQAEIGDYNVNVVGLEVSLLWG